MLVLCGLSIAFITTRVSELCSSSITIAIAVLKYKTYESKFGLRCRNKPQLSKFHLNTGVYLTIYSYRRPYHTLYTRPFP